MKQLVIRKSVKIVEVCEYNASSNSDMTLDHERQEQLYYEPFIKNLQTHKATGKFTVTVKLNNKPHTMEVDSGAAFSVIGQFDFQRLYSGQAPVIKPTKDTLKDYQNALIATIGVHGFSTVRLQACSFATGDSGR